MVHITSEGEVLEISGDYAELASDASAILAVASAMIVNGDMKDEDGNEIDLGNYIEAVLLTIEDSIQDYRVSKGLTLGCVGFIEEMSKKIGKDLICEIEEEGEITS